MNYTNRGEVTLSFSGSGGIFSFCEKEKDIRDFKPTRVTFSGLTTVVFWSDDTKTLVTCGDNDVYDRNHAVAMAIAHKMFGSKNQFKKFVEKGYEAMTVDEDLDRRRAKTLKKIEQDEFPY